MAGTSRTVTVTTRSAELTLGERYCMVSPQVYARSYVRLGESVYAGAPDRHARVRRRYVSLLITEVDLFF